ncbi:MAG: TonB-dependent receptor [Amphiplicatus sp.]
MSKKTMVGRYLRSTMLSGVAAAVAAPMALVATSAIVAPAAAQDYTSGAISGNVVDASGNPISGATVTIRSLDQGFSRSATSTSVGGFRFASLPPGSYEITATSGGQSETIESARVAASSTANFTVVLGAAASSGDEVVVTGTRQNFDFANTTTGVNIDVEDLAKNIPVGRDLSSLTLLAPGTARGDTAFGDGNLTSVGGGSVAENAYYLNGLNITDFNNYLGSSVVPFEFYKSVEVKTGGYPAEFGRATGGVINAVTKSGTNDFFAAIHLNWEPDALRSDAPDTIADGTTGAIASRNGLDEERNFDAILEVGGPIIKDRLFVYGLVEMNDNVRKDASALTGVQIADYQKSPFWGVKVDAYPIDNHHLEFTYFDTDRTTVRRSFDYDSATDTIGTVQTGETRLKLGGESFVAKYTGNLAQWLTVSGAYGKNNDRNEQNPIFGSFAQNSVTDQGDGTTCGGVGASCTDQTTTVLDNPQITQREFYRADADVFFNFLGDHHIRMGWEKEKNYLEHFGVRTGPDAIVAPNGIPGGLAYIVRRCVGSRANICTGTPTIAPGSTIVELNYYNTGGEFNSENIAYYIQDEWNVTDRLTLNLGVRLDQFNNFTADGSQFVDFNKLFAPRAGFSYDPWGDGTGRLYGSFGVYFLPVAGNTAFRQGAQEYYFREFWTFNGVDAEGLPILDQQLTNWGGQNCPFELNANGSTSAPAGSASCAVTGDGSIQDPTASISQNLRATREREIIVGYEHQLTDLWTVGINYTRRNLRTNAEDAAIDAAVIDFCNDPANGIDQSTTACSSIWTGFHQYTIINPGFDQTITLADPLPGETEQRTLTFSAESLGYPKASRLYQAVEFTFERAFDGVWALQGSYSWSESKGNSEGYVQSDFGQDDAGITQDFDQAIFTEGADGLLPNHRRHRLKVWGNYQVTEAFSIGSQLQLASPRPLSCFGYHPLGTTPANYIPYVANLAYGAASHYCGGELAPRGEGEKTDWLFNMDIALRYNLEMPSGQDVTLRADVFNIFNIDGVQERFETGELSLNNPHPRYGLATAYQEPRYVRFGVDITF